MGAGRYRDRLTIEEITVTGRDAHGKETVDWTKVADVWGRIVYLRGNELFQSDQTESRATIRIWIRRRDGLTTKNRIRKGSRIFNLTSVPDEGVREPTMALMAIEAQ